MWLWRTAMPWRQSISRARQFAVKGYFDTRLPSQSYFGAEPEALALSADGRRLYVANSGPDAIAVMDTPS